jgi:hypothetical protein
MTNNYAYFDHNIFDHIIKGDELGIVNLIATNNLIPVISRQNFKEISQSVGYEDTFVSLLADINVQFIEPVVDKKYRYTGNAKIFPIDTKDVYQKYIQADEQLPEAGYGLFGMLEKFYEGRPDESFAEIFVKGFEEVSGLFTQEEISSGDEEIDKQLKEFQQNFPQLMKGHYDEIVSKLNSSNGYSISETEKMLGVGPVILNNIKPPKIVEQIIEKISKTEYAVQFDVLKLFDGSFASIYPDHEPSIVEKINSIYHQLNYLGYHRDKKMSKTKMFNASMADMTHASFACFCKALFSFDADFIHKTHAAYEYLGVYTELFLMKHR